MMLSIKKVSKFYTRKDNSPLTALKNINLKIKKNEFISLLGPSGCGKSTLLSILAGLKKPSQGKILINNQTLEKTSTKCGVVFQDDALFPWLNVIDNVSFGLVNNGMSKEKAHEKAMTYIKKVHLSKFINSYPHQLSGGMKQRVAIARALVMEPDLLLMDEPFGALDEQTRFMLQNELQKIWLESKTTIVFVTHNIREAVKLSDRIAVFSAQPGKIKKVFTVQAAHPRDKSNNYLLNLENKILDLLKIELKKVMKEEIGDEYDFEKSNFYNNSDSTLGGNI